MESNHSQLSDTTVALNVPVTAPAYVPTTGAQLSTLSSTQVIMNWCFVGIGIPALLLNIPTVFVIARTEKLRQRREVLLIAVLSLCEITYAGNNILWGVMSFANVQRTDKITPQTCLGYVYPAMVPVLATTVLTANLAVAIDRCLCIYKMQWYLELGKTYVVLSCGSTLLIFIARLIAAISSAALVAPVVSILPASCGTSNIEKGLLTTISMWLNFVLSVSSVVVYVTALIGLPFMVAETEFSEIQQLARRRQLKIVRLMAPVCASVLLGFAMPSIVSAIANFIDSSPAANAARLLIVTLVKTCHSVVYAILFWLRPSVVRQQLAFHFIRCGKQLIGDISESAAAAALAGSGGAQSSKLVAPAPVVHRRVAAQQNRTDYGNNSNDTNNNNG